MLTIREIKDILKREHISISKRRGQNFLVDAWVQRKIVEAIDIKPDDVILEIGPGLGALTENLAQLARRVIAVEKDKALARILKEKLSRHKNLEIIHQDILQFDIGKKKIKVVGNLPYYITTPIIGYLLEKQREGVKDIFITVQNEVGKRLVAKKGTKDYSAITILTQYFTKPKLLFSIPKRAFYPQPKVDSVFIHLRILKNPSVKVNNQEQFFKIVHSCFQQRRKTILNSLSHQKKAERDTIQQALQEAGIDFGARPERLSLDEFAKIEDIFYTKGVRL
ncbi:MAG: ribosomal RNA small subunit methyltransferase A [Candidatus Omnitrophica bacterium]|nr:ribosomal RNA small subunit methyltransferase A [Candidatus Omnitrophota bacterium]